MDVENDMSSSSMLFLLAMSRLRIFYESRILSIIETRVIRVCDFPKIVSPQVALAKANYFTGQILNCDFRLFSNNSGQEMYTIFDSLGDAEQYI